MTNTKNLEQKTGQMLKDSYTKKNSFLDTLSQIFSISDSIYSSRYNPKNKKPLSSSSIPSDYSYKFYSLFV